MLGSMVVNLMRELQVVHSGPWFCLSSMKRPPTFGAERSQDRCQTGARDPDHAGAVAGDGAGSMEPAKFRRCSVLLTFQEFACPRLMRDTGGVDSSMRPQTRNRQGKSNRGHRTNPGASRCLVMRHREQQSIGPMSTQRAHGFAICPALPLMPTTAAGPSEVPTSRKRPTREDAVRIAKAKISRRQSLRMQREAQKARMAYLRESISR